METESAENSKKGNLPPEGSHAVNTERDADREPQDVSERLERVEAALGLVMNHLQTVTKGSEILEASRARNMLSSIALGFSSIALIVLGGVEASDIDTSIDISRFSLGMALLFLASVLDLASGMLLHRAISGAVLNKDPKLMASWQGTWRRFLQVSYWSELKRESRTIYYCQVVRCSAFVVYLIAGVFLIWALFYL